MFSSNSLALSTKLIRFGASKAMLHRSTAQVVAKSGMCSMQRYTPLHVREIVPPPKLPPLISKRFKSASSKATQSPVLNASKRTYEDMEKNYYDGFGTRIADNITYNTFKLPQRRSDDPNNFHYDEDYDKDNLHMTPTSISSRDGERLSELEMTQHEDVRIPGDGSAESISFYDEEDDDDDYYDFDESQGGDRYEFEEYEEIMHTVSEKSANGPCQVLDNVDDINGIVL